MYLFDTDIITSTIKTRSPACLIARLRDVPAAAQHISTITVSEMVYGAMESSRHEYYLAFLRDVLLPAITVLPFDAAAAYVYGEIRAGLERRGTPVAHADLQIAAIALANELTLVTGNERHFRRIPGLRVENWLQ